MTEGHEARKVTRQAKISLIILACLSVALVSVAVVIVTAADHAATRAEGCFTSRYQNDIPAEVVRAVRAQHARGIDRPLWQIQGIETPLGPDGPGVAEVWTTEPFAIVP